MGTVSDNPKVQKSENSKYRSIAAVLVTGLSVSHNGQLKNKTFETRRALNS